MSEDNIERRLDQYFPKGLKINIDMAKSIYENIMKVFDEAEHLSSELNRPASEIAGFLIADLIYQYLQDRDLMVAREALTFIKISLGQEMLQRRAYTDIDIGTFIVGLSYRWIRGYEKLRERILELDKKLEEWTRKSWPPK